MKRFSWVLAGTLLFMGCGKDEKFTDDAPKKDVKTDVTVEKSPAEAAKAAEPAEAKTPKAEQAVEVSPKPEEAAREAPAEEAPAEDAPAEDTPKDIEMVEVGRIEEGVAPGLDSPMRVERDGIHIAALTLARGVEKSEDNKRVPVDPGTSFDIDGRRVYAIFDIENPNEEASELKIGWIPPGSAEEQNRVSLTVKPKKTWRTWAFNGFAKKAGVWQVVVRDSEDAVIARAAFEMK